jgi:hypothetical protein
MHWRWKPAEKADEKLINRAMQKSAAGMTRCRPRPL